MPVYGFRCPQCGLAFDVSRPMRLAGDPATCPMDGTPSDRIFAAIATIGGAKQEQASGRIDGGAQAPPPPPPPAPQPSGYAHFGHSHGAGVGGHAHGGFRPQPPAAGNNSGTKS
jgi:putative FmdB family regulatory protein